MQLIPLAPATVRTADTNEQAAEAAAGVIGCIGAADFGREALAQLNRWLPVSWWSVFRLYGSAPPAMPAAGSYGAPDHTKDSWNEYRDRLHSQDETFAAARQQICKSRQLLLMHWHAREIPRVHRERIYTRHGLRERLSVACMDEEPGGGLLAVNLYRHDELPAFNDREFESVGLAARLLLSCIRRHLHLAGDPSTLPGALDALTRREREVCERMLKGWTHEGIAADLGISPGTVKTYRDRAFERLGIHHRNELFALVAGRLSS